MTPAMIPQGFRDTNRIFEEQVVGQRDFAALARVYTSDATIEEFWKQTAAALGVKSVALDSLSVEVWGDAAYEIGRAEIARSQADPMTAKYVVVWKQQGGVWKWHVDIWNAVS